MNATLLKSGETPRIIGAYKYSELSINARINYRALYAKDHDKLIQQKIYPALAAKYNGYIFCPHLLA